MKLSTKGRYGVRAMFDLALNSGQGPIPLNNVAERQNISGHYLEQLIALLKKAGLVKSVRGAQGGYFLARDPEEITIGDIIRVLEGPIAPVDCVNEEEMEICENAEYCLTRKVWTKVRDSVTDVLDSITLADLVKDQAKLNEKSYMFYI